MHKFQWLLNPRQVFIDVMVQSNNMTDCIYMQTDCIVELKKHPGILKETGEALRHTPVNCSCKFLSGYTVHGTVQKECSCFLSFLL